MGSGTLFGLEMETTNVGKVPQYVNKKLLKASYTDCRWSARISAFSNEAYTGLYRGVILSLVYSYFCLGLLPFSIGSRPQISKLLKILKKHPVYVK